MNGHCACRASPCLKLGMRPEVGSRALAAWLARRVATVKPSGPSGPKAGEAGPEAALKQGLFGDYPRRPGDPTRKLSGSI